MRYVKGLELVKEALKNNALSDELHDNHGVVITEAEERHLIEFIARRLDETFDEIFVEVVRYDD